MGCECFGPRRSRSQVFIKLIQNIHEDARKITAEQILKFQEKGIDIFKLISERIIKKGDIRKLVDNLSSRKHRVQDSLIFNYGQFSQSKQMQTLYTGLIITDSITQAMYPRQMVPQSQIQSEMSSQIVIQLKKQSFTQFTQKSDKNIKHKTKYYHNNESNIGTDEQYFKSIIFLFGLDKRLKPKVLESIKSFCERHVGIFACDFSVWKLIEMLVADINSHTDKERSCEVFKYLLIHTRDKITEHMKNRNHLETLIFLWLEEQNNLDHSSIRYNSAEMLSIYFNRFITAWESEFLYQPLFHAFDKIQFNKASQPHIQRLCEQIIENSMLRTNFLRSQFNYLIGYLLILPQNLQHKKQLMTTLGLKLDNIKLIYKNAMKNKVKVQGFRRLNAWIDKKYSNINQFSLYNGNCLIYVFIYNLIYFSSDSETFQSIMIEFSKLYNKLSKQEKHRLIQRSIEQFERISLSQGERKILQILIKQMISNQEIRKSEFNEMNFFVPIQLNFNQAHKIQILNLNTFLLESVQIQQIDELGRARLADFMYSLYSSMVSEQINFNQKYQILCKTASFLQIIGKKMKKNCLLAFFQNICDKNVERSKFIDIQSQLCLLYLGFVLRQIIYGLKIPQRLSNIKISLDKLNNKEDGLSQINTYFFDKDQLKIQEKLQQINKLQYTSFKLLFEKLFRTKHIDKLESIEKRSLLFNRNNSIPRSQETLSMQSQDRSFGEAIQILVSK